MRVIFLNTFEKRTNGQEKRCVASLAISEEDGVWLVQWTDDEGQHDWYKGGFWDELIASFRHGIAVQMGNGYVPLLDGMLDERKPAGEGSRAAKLQCYGELHPNQQLFDELRSWRRSKAIAEKKTAYMIANNRMLWMISSFVPHTIEELQELPGWGEGKLNAYGGDIIGITASYEQPRPFPLDWVAEEIGAEQYAQWLFKQKEAKFKAQIGRHQKHRLLLQLIQEGHTLEQIQEMLELSRREAMERIEQLEAEGYDVEPLIVRELEGMPDDEQQKVWDALADVGDKYLKPVLHSVYGEEPAEEVSLDKLYDRLRLIRLRYRRQQIS